MNSQRLEELSRPKTAANSHLKQMLNQNEDDKSKELLQKEMIKVADDNGELPLIFQKNPVFLVFENKLQAELFNARCHDTGEVILLQLNNLYQYIFQHISQEKAKAFKEEFNRINLKKNKNVLNLNSMRLGVNCMITLSALLQDPKLKEIDSLNLADNAISDNGMHSIKSIIANAKIKHLNLSSNMVSESGLEMIVDDLNLGVQEGSIRKNSLGIDGAKCIAAVILQNKNIETICLQDNDIGITGGEIIGTALKQNKTLRNLTIAENDLKTAGAEFILKSAGKNHIKSGIGSSLKTYLETNFNLKQLNLEFNELLVAGTRDLTMGLLFSRNLLSLNLKGNGIKDEGLQLISRVLCDNYILEDLDVSLNEITPIGISYLAEAIPQSGLKTLNLSKNLLGDESLMIIADKAEGADNIKLQKIEINSSRIADAGILHFLERIDYFENIKCIKVSDNFISEQIEKVLIEILERNKTLVEFQINGNRFSLSCTNKIKKILQRNIKEHEEREPNKIKTEIYRLKYEQQKIEAARRKLDQHEKQINDLETHKIQLEHKLQNLKKTEEHKRQDMNIKMQEQKATVQRKKDLIDEKNQKFEERKTELLTELHGLQQEFEGLDQERNKVSDDLQHLNKDVNKMEDDFKEQFQNLDHELQKQKQKKEDFDKKNADLNHEYSQLLKMEQELTEQVLLSLDKQKSTKKKNKKAPSLTKL